MYMGGNRALSSMSMNIIDQFSRVARMARDTTSSFFLSPDECDHPGLPGRGLVGSPTKLGRCLPGGVQEPPWRLACKAKQEGRKPAVAGVERCFAPFPPMPHATDSLATNPCLAFPWPALRNGASTSLCAAPMFSLSLCL